MPSPPRARTLVSAFALTHVLGVTAWAQGSGAQQVRPTEAPHDITAWVDLLELGVSVVAATDLGAQLAGGSASSHSVGIYVPLGVNWMLSQHVDGVVEFGPYVEGRTPNPGVACTADRPPSRGEGGAVGCRTWLLGATGSVGAAALWNGRRRGVDFFVQLKAIGGVAVDRGFPPSSNPQWNYDLPTFSPGTAWEVGVGLDLGVEYRGERLFAAAMLGGDVAGCFSCGGGAGSEGVPNRPTWAVWMLAAESQPPRRNYLAFGPNLSLVRVGAAF